MLSYKLLLKTFFQIFLILSFLFGNIAPFATASAYSENPPPAGSIESDISSSITLGENPDSPSQSVSILSEEIAKQAQQQSDVPIQINLSAEPAIYIPGKPVIIKWKIIGDTASQRKELAIVARPPDGVLPFNPTDKVGTDGSVIISPSADQGTMVWKILDYAKLPLSFTFELVSNGKLLNSNIILIAEPLATTIQGQSSKVTSRDGKVKVTIPSNANASPLLMDIRLPEQQSLPGTSLSWNPVEIIAVDRNSQKNVKRFSNPITIQLKYDESEIFNWDERDLSIFYYDPSLKDWFPMKTVVDTATNTLTTQSDHLTVFDYKANNWQSTMVPTVDAFKAADFTGAASYQVNMWTPPAPGGLQPHVTLSYNSQVIDEATAYDQASWAGMGWDIGTGAVTRNMHGTDTDLTDDTFMISAGGISGLLLPVSTSGGVTQYNTIDQSFLKVVDNGGSFTAWAKNGTKYEFNKAINTNKDNGCAAVNIAWRWVLTKVTDTNGNTLDYTYFTETKPGCANEIAVYPATITYGNGKYRVNFVREARTDYQTAWTAAASKALYGTQRLKEVQIQHNNGVWANVRRYVLSYAPNNAANIYPNFNFSAGGKTLTLVGIQEFGADGSAFPAVTFAYSDNLHLTTVNNGQGGSVTMAYSIWQYVDRINNDIRSLTTDFSQECSGIQGPPPNWVQIIGVVRCDPKRGPVLWVGMVTGSTYSIAERYMPLHLVKPGAKYWFKINVSRINFGGIPSTMDWGFTDGAQSTMATGALSTTFTDLGQDFIMPVTYNPETTKLRFICSGCQFRSFEFFIYPSMYRVTSRTVTVQPSGLTSTYTYQYDNASPATTDNSAVVAAAGTNYNTLYTTKALGEFRGHAMSQVTNPQGLTTVNWFWQADALKGRPYDTFVLNRDTFDALESVNANWTTTGTATAAAASQKDFDNSIKSVNGTLTRIGSLAIGKVAVAHVRLGSGTGTVKVGSTVITLNSTGTASVNGVALLGGSNFILDEWYAVMIFTDAANNRVRIWQLDNPNNSGEAVLTTGGGGQFSTGVSAGTMYIDSYFEGTPYSETITRYESMVQYDTTAGGTIPDIANATLMTFKDLAVSWVYPTSVENRNYNGDASFVGTKQDFIYTTTYGNLASQVESGNDGSGWVTYRKTHYEYYPNMTAPNYIVGVPARQTLTDADNVLKAETLYFYDNATVYAAPPAKGNLTTQRTWAGGADYAQTSMTYYANGNLWTQSAYTEYGTATSSPSDLSKQTTTITYDTAGYNTYPVAVTNQLNQTVTTNYNYALGLPSSMTDANGVTTSATYDGFGRVKTITAPGDTSPTLQVNYSDASIPIKVDLIQTLSASSIIRLSRFYDGAGRQIQTQTATAVVNGSLQNIVADTQYNNLGQAVKQTVPYTIASNVTPAFNAQTFSQPYTSTAYDVLSRPTTITAPNNTVVSYTYADLATTVIDPRLNSATTTVDVWGRTTLVDAPTGPDVSYQYDVLNRLTDSTRAGEITHIEYDVLGHKLNMSDPDMGYWQYTYDALGNLKSQTDAKNQITCLYYDALNRLDGKIYSTSGGCSTPVNFDVDFIYDLGPNGIGRRTGMSDVSGSTTWFYDPRGRLSTEEKTITGATTPFSTTWGYNSGDLPILMVYPDGETLTYGYNSDGTLKTVSSSIGGTYLNDMQYDEAGRLKLIQYGANVINKTFNYFPFNTADMGGLLSSVTTSSASPLQNLAYTYDKNGNVLTIVDSLSGPQTQTFTYDALNRITSAAATGGANGLYSETYDYDPTTGNLSLKNGQTYTYGDTAHIHAATALSNGNSYVYDPNGNMITRTVSGQTFDLVYDTENHLTGVSAQGVQILPTATQTLTPTSFPTATNIPTLTLTGTNTLTPTETFTPSDTLTPTETGIPSDTPTVTETITDVPQDTTTPIFTPTETQTPDPLATATETQTPDPLATATDIPASTSTPTETGTPTETSAPISSPTGTETASITNTPFRHSPNLTATSTPPPAGIFANASFFYDGDGQRVKSLIQTNIASTATYFVGNYYEVTGRKITKYYFAGSQRIAMRTYTSGVFIPEQMPPNVLSYLIGDHLGSASLVTDFTGNHVSQQEYKAWGETRYTSGTEVTKYQYTGQYSHTADFGLMFYNARWYDPSLGRFAQADSIVPGGVQGWDRYAYTNNNPVRYVDPSGHESVCGQANSDPECGDLGHSELSHPHTSGGRDSRDNDSRDNDRVEEDTVYMGGATPAGIPGFSTQEQVQHGGGTPSQRYDVLGEFNTLASMFSPSAPSTLNVYLRYYMMANGDITKMNIIIQNSGASSASLNYIQTTKEPLPSMNSCTQTETCLFLPNDSVNVDPGSEHSVTICTNCLSNGTDIYSMPNPIDRNSETQVFLSMTMLINQGRETVHSSMPFMYTIPRR